MAPTASLPWSEGPHGHGPGRSCWTPQTAVCPLWAFDAGTTCVLWHCFSASKCSVHFPRVDLHIFGCSGRRPHYIHTHIYIYSRLPQHWINSSKPMGGRGAGAMPLMPGVQIIGTTLNYVPRGSPAAPMPALTLAAHHARFTVVQSDAT